MLSVYYLVVFSLIVLMIMLIALFITRSLLEALKARSRIREKRLKNKDDDTFK